MKSPKSPLIAPSILNCDFLHLASELDKIKGADWVHVDVMDNHFVPNLSFGMPIVEKVLAHTNLAVDAHLMIENPEKWAPEYAQAGCHSVTFHLEAATNAQQVISDLHRYGSKACVALKPGTQLEAVKPYLHLVDMVLIMTVEPGFGGQSFMADMMPKVKQLRELISAENLEILVQVDGGISLKTIDQAASAGADVFVAGSAVYKADDAGECIEQLRSLAASHLHC